MKAVNDYLAGVIRLYHTREDTNQLENIVAIDVYRRCADVLSADREWTLAGTKTIVTSDDKDFVFVDYSARHGEKYDYKTVVSVLEGENKVTYDGVECSVESSVCGVVIASGDQHYAINFNVTYSAQRNYNMSYIQPYHSKYPHAVQNGDANFSNGTVSGYFNAMDENCSLKGTTGLFAEMIENFLTDGRIKTLKTYDGYIWRVVIDTPIKREKTNTRDLVFFSFSWHAVADAIPAGYFA